MKASHNKLTAGILAVGFYLNGSVMAASIVGGISFVGDYTPNDPNSLLTSTLITFDNVKTTSTTGDFATFVGDGAAVTSPDLPINSALAPQTVWSVSGFSLTLTSLEEQFNTQNSLTLYGTGNITGPAGFTPTLGDWTATFNRSGSGTLATFSWSASSSSSGRVPDGSSALALLGMSLFGIEGIRRKLISRKS